MANTHTNLNELFTDIADAIRDKTGSEETIVADNFPSEIQNIQVGVDTSDATATAADIKTGKTAYVNGGKVTGSMAQSNVEMFMYSIYITDKNVKSITVPNSFPTDTPGTIYVNGNAYINTTRYTVFRNRNIIGDANTGGDNQVFTVTTDGNNIIVTTYYPISNQNPSFEQYYTNTFQFIKEIST